MIYFFKYGINYFIATITDRTISQLKNNGGMRLIKNKEVADQIMLYYNLQNGLDDQGNNVKASELANNNEANHIFNIIANRPLFDSFMVSPSFGISTPIDKARTLLTRRGPCLLTYDQKAIASFMGDIDYQKGVMAGYILHLIDQKTQAGNLIKLIQAEYHLENE